MPEKPRAILYVDGFNLYYPIHRIGLNHLKWLDLVKLGRLICQDRGHELINVTYCSAYQRNAPDKFTRHRRYIEALESTGLVTVHLGHYMRQDTEACTNCGIAGTKETEKQSDINLALSLYADAVKGRFDWAYLLSADSDQAATAKFLQNHFPDKRLVTVAPPGKDISPKILSFADGKRNLNQSDIEKCLFPPIIMQENGGHPIRCPKEYEPRR